MRVLKPTTTDDKLAIHAGESGTQRTATPASGHLPILDKGRYPALRQSVATRVAETEVLRSPERIRETLRALFAHRCGGRIRTLNEGRRTIARIQAARVEPEQRFPLHWQLDEPTPELPFMIEVEGYLSVFRFEVREASQSGGFLAVAAPTEITRSRSRMQRRIPIGDGVTVVFKHPQWPDLRVRRPVRNVSLSGIAFSTSTQQDALSAGLVIEDVVVEWEDRLRLEFRGIICDVYDDLDGHGDVAGLQIVPRSNDDATHWRDLVMRLLCPNTRMDGTWSKQLWELYDRSGYFQLSAKSEPEFRPLRSAFERGSRKIAEAPELGCQIVWPSNRGIEAAASTLKIYEGTSFLYQVARQHGRAPLWSPGRRILRDIHTHAITQMQSQVNLRWLLVWVQETARFSRLAYYDLPKRYVEEGRGLVWHFRAMEGTCEHESPAPPKNVQVGPATPNDVTELLQTLSRTRPPAYCDAHDLVPERLAFQGVKAAWSAAGLVRDRQVLVARDGDARAAAILEFTEDGLHLFGLLDVVRLCALSQGGENLFLPLLNAARNWYRARGKLKFLYFLESDDMEHAKKAGLIDLGAADMTLLHADLLPELLEHLHELVAPRDVPPLTPDT